LSPTSQIQQQSKFFQFISDEKSKLNLKLNDLKVLAENELVNPCTQTVPIGTRSKTIFEQNYAELKQSGNEFVRLQN
jgi:hypothetical protein